MLTYGIFSDLLKLELDEEHLPNNAASSINSALRHFASYWAHGQTFESTVTSAGSVLMPSDYLQMHAVREAAGGQIMVRYLQIPDDSQIGKGWYEWPSGTLQFPVYRGRIQAFYYSYYPTVEDHGDRDQPFPVPLWAVKGLLILSTAYIKFPEATSDATLNQFNTRLDSGNPEDIPLLVAINFLREQYREEIKVWPQQRREYCEPNPR